MANISLSQGEQGRIVIQISQQQQQQQQPQQEQRFASTREEETADALSTVDQLNTRRATGTAVRILRDYCHAKRRSAEFENLPVKDLAGLLRQFYLDIRKKDGSLYSKASLSGIRSGLARFILNKCDVDIVKDRAFISANKAFKTQKMRLNKAGLSVVFHYPEITFEDLCLLYDPNNSVFNVDMPTGLQLKVFFEIMLHFRWKGRDDIRKMNKDTFALAQDDDGTEYVYRTRPNACNDTSGVMYASPGNSNCPVRSFKKYINELHPHCHDLWQHPNSKYPYFDHKDVWYINSAVGHNSLSNFMALISKEGGLSQVYTNRSIHVTGVAILNGMHDGKHFFNVNKDSRQSISIRSNHSNSASTANTNYHHRTLHSEESASKQLQPATATSNKRVISDITKVGQSSCHFDRQPVNSRLPLEVHNIVRELRQQAAKINHKATTEQESQRGTSGSVIQSSNSTEREQESRSPQITVEVPHSVIHANSPSTSNKDQPVSSPQPRDSQLSHTIASKVNNIKEEPAEENTTENHYIEFDGKLHWYDAEKTDENAALQALIAERFNDLQQQLPSTQPRLPPSWSVAVTETYIHILKMANRQMPVIDKSLTINRDLSFMLAIHSHILPKDHILHQDCEGILSNMDSVHQLVKKLDCFTT
ncbi:uncharacterized protein [Ptychodera flava]|uniref:uncharacterized protein n=1 Tax=Ptychodera flava TaxID=63121 RepID=UPI00396A4DAA